MTKTDHYKSKPNKNKNQTAGLIKQLNNLTREKDDDQTSSDNIVDYVYLPETKFKLNNVDNHSIYESHTVNGLEIVFYTLTESDVDDVLQLDKLYLDSDQTRESVSQNLSNNKKLLIGIKEGGHLQGYCQYKSNEDKSVKLIWFCANKTFGTPLYIFMEKYFEKNDYNKILITVSLYGQFAIRRLNFWYLVGFLTYDINQAESKIYMSKQI